jgi:hypothetical protein
MMESQPVSLAGNRCGHDPRNPRLSPDTPIRKGPGGLPRILSLAAERAKEWFFQPEKCPQLQTSDQRQTRSERREACQIVLEVLLSHLDLASLCVGAPTPNRGFVDIDMKTIVSESGLGQRRCERAINQLKAAGFISVKQPRYRNPEGKYLGLRAIRVIAKEFFDWLGLGPMLEKERARASAALRHKAQSVGKSVSGFMERLKKSFKKSVPELVKRLDLSKVRAWNGLLTAHLKMGKEIREAQRLTNAKFGYPSNWSPGLGDPAVD